MVKTKFNPGGPVEMYESAESGISPLIVIPRTTQKIEEDVRREDAEDESQGTRIQRRNSKWKSRSKALTKKLVRVKRKASYIYALLWVLFGYMCPLYDQINKFWRVLNHPSIKAVMSKFTRIWSAHITWQVLEETRLFFNQQLGPNYLQIGGPRRFPKAELGRLIDDVR